MVRADVLSDLLAKQYDAKSLSDEVVDSLLNGGKVVSDDEKYLPQYRYDLRHENEHKMFRHSFAANYYLWDKHKSERIAVSDTLIRDAAVSPNGQYVVYGKGQDLYIYKVLYKSEVPILEDSYKAGQDIFYGLSDWLYEEEFGITRMFWFSPESKQVAFVRLDERQVPAFAWQTYLDKQYPDMESLRYPKAGAVNATATVCVYDISTKGIRTMQLPEMTDSYIPRLRWRSEEELVIERLSRDQNQLEVYVANPKSTVCTLLYKEKSDNRYVDYALWDEWQWLSDGRIILMSEKDGWRSLYLYSAQGVEQKRLTPEGIDVTAVLGKDEKSGMVYYQAAPIPSERQLYAVNLKSGKINCMTEGSGVHSAWWAKDGKMAIETYQSDTRINHYTLYSVTNGTWKELPAPAEIQTINDKNDSIQRAYEVLNLPQ